MTSKLIAGDLVSIQPRIQCYSASKPDGSPLLKKVGESQQIGIVIDASPNEYRRIQILLIDNCGTTKIVWVIKRFVKKVT